ncbi:MAG: hypothetical protein LBL90_14070 [Prevotellaceae bacterium]|nr:hypothetical protein [Prevotellaceae bacterium]
MKKILLSCLTVLFALSIVNAQTFNLTPNPPSPNPGGRALYGEKTLFICQGQQRPVDLSYDVLGEYLSLDKGHWDAVWSPVGLPLPASTYDGQNVFKVIDAGLGVYVFDFYPNVGATFCGVNDGHYFRAYVVIVPSFTSEEFETIEICWWRRAAELAAVSNDPLDYIPQSTKDLVTSFGGTFTASPTNWTNITANDALNVTYHYSADITFTINGVNNYPCDNTFTVKMSTKVVEEPNVLAAQTRTMCVSEAKLESPKTAKQFFGRITRPGDSYTPQAPATDPIIFAELAKLTVPGTYNFEYKYPDCTDQSPQMLTVTDVLIITADDAAPQYLPAELTVCKPDLTADIMFLNTAYDLALPTVKAYMGNKAVHWYYVGPNKDGSSSSHPNPFVGGLNPSFDKRELSANVPYFFKFALDASAGVCSAGASDTLTIIGFDGTSAGDGRLQVCLKDATYNLSEILGLKTSVAVWDYVPAVPVNGTPLLSGSPQNTITVKESAPNATLYSTYKYAYNQSGPGACGSSTGVFYLTVTENMVASTDITEAFCITSLPASVNMFYVMGIQVPGAFTVTTGAAAPYFNTTTGILDIVSLSNLGVADYDFEFAPTAGGCITNTIKIRISIVSSL